MNPKTTNKAMRFDVRLPMEQKLFIEKAAHLGGYRSLTEFIVSIAMEKAKEIVVKNEQMIVSQRDSDLFFKTIMQQSMPNQELVDAVDEYNQLFVE
jgi:uncharacterized protein (DUF1778 family)